MALHIKLERAQANAAGRRLNIAEQISGGTNTNFTLTTACARTR
jgi:hypothetical protein